MVMCVIITRIICANIKYELSLFCVIYLCITVCAVSQHCCKGDERFQWEMPFSGSSSSGTAEPIFKKFCRVDYVGDPTPHAKIFDQSAQRGVSAHA